MLSNNVILNGENKDPDRAAHAIVIDRYVVLDDRVRIDPPQRKSASTKKMTYYPVKIGSYVVIGSGSDIRASVIGSNVSIGRNCKIGSFVIIKDCVVIKDGTVVPDFSTVAPMSIVSGDPQRFEMELPESAEEVLELHARRRYNGIVDELPF